MSASPFSIGLREVTLRRLAGIHCHELKSIDGDTQYPLCAAVPASYDVKTRHRYPVILLLDAAPLFGSVVEMTRLMAQTREIRECIVIGLETPIPLDNDVQHWTRLITEQLLPWCSEKYRVTPGQVAVFGGHSGLVTALIHAAGADVLQPLSGSNDNLGADDPLPTLVSGLRRHLGTGHQYGSELMALGNPLLSKTLGALRPIVARLRSTSTVAPGSGNPHVMRSQTLARDFEIFAIPPASATTNPSRRYPALLVLDANIELSIAAETAARMARCGEIEEVMIIGIGIPRSEGMIEFGFRRFEEFSPPPDGYQFDDRLGRVFRSLFATRGQDARQCVGKAPRLQKFLVDELLPALLKQLPIDENNLGILGHSAGGAFVSYVLRQERSPFRSYAAISPGVGMSGSWLRREPQVSCPLAAAARQAYFCVGGDEKANHFCQIAGIPDTEELSRQTQRQKPELKVQFHCFDGETHSTVYALGISGALRSLYGITHIQDKQ